MSDDLRRELSVLLGLPDCEQTDTDVVKAVAWALQENRLNVEDCRRNQRRVVAALALIDVAEVHGGVDLLRIRAALEAS